MIVLTLVKCTKTFRYVKKNVEEILWLQYLLRNILQDTQKKFQKFHTIVYNLRTEL